MKIGHLLLFRFISFLNIYSGAAPDLMDTEYSSESNLQQDSCRGICTRMGFQISWSNDILILFFQIFSVCIWKLL